MAGINTFDLNSIAKPQVKDAAGDASGSAKDVAGDVKVESQRLPSLRVVKSVMLCLLDAELAVGASVIWPLLLR